MLPANAQHYNQASSYDGYPVTVMIADAIPIIYVI